MQFIKDWATGLVVISLVSSIVYLLSPSGQFEKQVKTAVSIILLVTITVPFFKIKSSDNAEVESYVAFTENDITVNEKGIVENFQDVTVEKITETLKASGFISVKVFCDAEINGNNELYIDEVTICISKDDSGDAQKIFEIIKEEYGIAAQVEVSD